MTYLRFRSSADPALATEYAIALDTVSYIEPQWHQQSSSGQLARLHPRLDDMSSTLEADAVEDYLLRDQDGASHYYRLATPATKAIIKALWESAV